MKTKSTHTMTPLTRAVTYFLLFTAATVTIEIIRNLTVPRSWTAITLVFATIGILVLIGGFFINERNLLSRVVSASIMLALGFVATAFESLAIYMLPLAIGLAYLGARPFLHQGSRNITYNVTFSALFLISTGLFILAFLYGMSVLRHILYAS